MCHASCVLFTLNNLSLDDVKGKSILEVGSLDVNGSIKGIIKKWGPGEYIGTDIFEGPNVDMLCPAEELVSTFGKERFDLIIANELLEHVIDWKDAISNIKGVCRTNGSVVITTRSRGFQFHPFPHDCWRYETDDMQHIFSDFEIVALEPDRQAPGVFIRARKPREYTEKDLSDYQLYSVVLNKRAGSIKPGDLDRPRIKMLKLNKRLNAITERATNIFFNRVVFKIFR